MYEHAHDTVPYGVLTGDTLFIGDVGRPDLLSSKGSTADELARQLYRSTREQLLTLPDETRVYPAHGAGSACGKQLSTETVSTIGVQRRTNYALAPMTEDAFVAAITEGQPVAPHVLRVRRAAQPRGRAICSTRRSRPAPMTFDDVQAATRDGAVVLDTREATEFAHGHLRGSFDVGLGGRFAEYAGDVLRPDTPIVLVTEPGRELEAKVRLARIGFDHVVGYLDDPVRVFVEHPDARASQLPPHHRRTAPSAFATGADVQLVDVRNPGEAQLGSIEGARNMPLPRLIDGLDDARPGPPDRRVLCRRVPLGDRGERTRRQRFRRRLRPARWVRRLGGREAARRDHSHDA